MVEVALVVVELVRVKLEICTKVGRDRVQVRLAERSWAPAEEVICPAVPAIVMVVAVGVYVLVSTERVPLLAEVLTKPSEVKLESLGIEAEPLTVRLERLPDVPKRLVEEAVVEKKLVEVAEVEVELIAVKFCRVVEPVARMFAAVRSEFTKPFVEVSEVEKKLVEVDWVVVDWSPVKFCSVVEPTTRRSPTPLMVVVALPPTRSDEAV